MVVMWRLGRITARSPRKLLILIWKVFNLFWSWGRGGRWSLVFYEICIYNGVHLRRKSQYSQVLLNVYCLPVTLESRGMQPLTKSLCEGACWSNTLLHFPYVFVVQIERWSADGSSINIKQLPSAFPIPHLQLSHLCNSVPYSARRHGSIACTEN